MATHPSPKRAPETPSIPDRLYFKIGDVARICKIETYVLRFWETQFPQLKPNKSGTGQRLYRKRDVEIALEIKRLVYTAGYTLSGARQALSHLRRAESSQADSPATEKETGKKRDKVAAAIGHARAELREIASLLTAAQPKLQRRRPRVSSMSATTDSLFPS
jgi:DNA-binding transcriptional MerR regulator